MVDLGFIPAALYPHLLHCLTLNIQGIEREIVGGATRQVWTAIERTESNVGGRPMFLSLRSNMIQEDSPSQG